MFLLILIMGIVLFPQAHCLTCVEWPSGRASCQPVQCWAEETRCGVGLLLHHGKSMTSRRLFDGCVSTQQCHSGSVTSGLERTVFSIECCDSDRCNENRTQERPNAKPNGRKCLFCDEQENCNRTLSCNGDEHFCFSATMTGSVKTKKGCASKSVCSAEVNIPDLRNISCCEEDNCNGASLNNGANVACTSSLFLATLLTVSKFYISD